MRSGSALLLAGEGAEALEGLYGSRQAQRVHARDQMVTGFRQSRARAAVVFGLDGIGGQSEQKRTGVGVNDGGAYRGSIGGPAARGRHRRWRAGAGDLGRPEMGETAWAAMQGSRSRTGWRR